MSASQSNLSQFGYDLVVAVTQTSVNGTMTNFLTYIDKPNAPEVTLCLIRGFGMGVVPTDYATLVQEAGADPFTIADGSDPRTNPDCIKLSKYGFVGAFKAQIGFPVNADPVNLPNVVTLGRGTTAPVTFNLFCQELQVVAVMNYGTTWINRSQPDDTPWYFSAQVPLNTSGLTSGASVPPALQTRIQQLTHSVGAGAFSIQQLLLDLDTAILLTTPTLNGVSDTTTFNALSTAFLGAYFNQLKQKGLPVLGYTVTINNPTPSTFQPRAMSFECCAPIGVNDPDLKEELTTLVYVGTASTTPPAPGSFSWNWLDAGDLSSYSGAIAIRRDIFMTYLQNLLNRDVPSLCFDTTVTMTHDGDDYSITYSAAPAASPGTFQLLPFGPIGAMLSFAHTSSDWSEAADHMSSIYGDFNYALVGTVEFGNAGLTITVTAVASIGFHHHELGIDYEDLPLASYYNKTLTVTIPLTVDKNGKVAVTITSNTVDNSTSWNFTPKGLAASCEGDVKSGLTKLDTNLTTALDNAFKSFAQAIADELNGYGGWVFPGAKSFGFKNVGFSQGQDLVANISYF